VKANSGVLPPHKGLHPTMSSVTDLAGAGPAPIVLAAEADAIITAFVPRNPIYWARGW
jgi:hypothetical protein